MTGGKFILDFKTQSGGKMLEAYESMLKFRLYGKKVLIHSRHPKWTSGYIDNQDEQRFGRRIGNYKVSGIPEVVEGIADSR